eukprot:TRINITY_DN3509_c0_g1_i1.p1 TRINITY_DN3509_c0_g1~~TRINITY_DN3509_c0_g1_i1.p1  ORF type:complete len:318 (+),score=17.69 TRINITY_DN3509_c0_g1_i1:82-1035(+)
MDFFMTKGRNPTLFFSEKKENIILGAGVWAATSLAVHPLEVLKVRLVQNGLRESGVKRGIVKKAIKEGLMRGWTVTAVEACCMRLMIPLIYEKTKIVRCTHDKFNTGLFCQGQNRAIFSTQDMFLELLRIGIVAGAVIGGTEACFKTVLNQLLIQQEMAKIQNYTPRRTVKSNIKWLGWDALSYVQGYMAVGVVGWAAFFSTYEYYLYWATHCRRLTTTDMAVAGALAGAAKTFFSHPLEVAHIRVSSYPFKWHESPRQMISPSVFQSVTLIQQRGMSNFYIGVAPALLRNMLLWAVSFPAYDYLQAELGLGVRIAL